MDGVSFRQRSEVQRHVEGSTLNFNFLLGTIYKTEMMKESMAETSMSHGSTLGAKGTNGRERAISDSSGGVTYAWKNLNVHALGKGLFKKGPETHILKDITGLCEPGQLLAIMGASGAGKTTLLNVLTFRAPGMRITGDIYINGRPANARTISAVSAYVQQEDLFTGVFTVKEQLNFHAQLRIGKGVKQSVRKQRIEEIMTELGLNKCADTLIGVPGRIKGISGGEKKRLAFACEMITNPLLLLCDEPTSGLDSFMAQSVVNAMKRLTSHGKTVIATIHQPSSEVFAMFDQLLLLAEGRVAYLGPTKDAFSFFNRLERPCPKNYNPGDHFIHTLAIKMTQEEDCRQFVHMVCDAFRESDGKSVDQRTVVAMQPPKGEDALANIKLPKSPYRASWFDQFAAVFRRSVYEFSREPRLLIAKTVGFVFFSILFGLIFLDAQSGSDYASVMNISGVLFIFVTNMTFSNMFPVVTVFSGVFPLFLKEHWNGMYRADVFFLTRNIVEFPIYIIGPFLFITISYWMIGFTNTVEAYLVACLIIVLIANVAVSYGYMISCMAKNYQTALIISTPLTFPLMIFGGFFIKTDTLPAWLSWMTYLSWFNYGFEALSINQWKDHPYSGPILESLGGFKEENLWIDIGAMVGLMVLYRILAFLLLLLQSRRPK
ncbi:unnamed protein product [Meganyctiphanes norvegica]|uniref:Protein white n=1 Tax=Meganyctiphanes norvegica TaxID=48144 RepID=A0AAV2S277_MEGNR